MSTQEQTETGATTGSIRGCGDLLARVEGKAVALTQRIAFAGVISMLIIGILTTVDVLVLRALFNSPIPGSNEFLNTIFSIGIAAVLASGLAQRANIEIDMLEGRLGQRATAWLRVASSAIFLLLLVILAWRVAVHSYESQLRGQATVILQWPMWPFLWGITALFVLCVPVQFVVFLSSIAKAIGRRQSTIAASIAPETSSTKFSPDTCQPITPTALALLLGTLAVAALVYFGIGLLRPVLASHGAAFAAFMCFALWGLILFLIPVGVALAFSGIVGTAVLMGFPQALSVLGSETVGLITSADLAVIPLFLIMGSFCTASGMSSDMYRLAHALFGSWRGGLAYATIGVSAGFGSVAGTSMGTVATVGAMAMPEMKRRGYSPELSTGCITAGGTLGQLVPPGTAIVVYALLVEESIGRLYIAILVPALLTAIFYMLVVAVTVRMNPSSAPGKDRFDAGEVVMAIKGCFSSFILLGVVFGGIFFGVFTATEAAAVGAVIAFLDALFRGKLGKGALWEVVGETIRSTAMMYFVIIGAMVFSFFVGTSGLPEALMQAVKNSGLSNLAIICLLVIGYVVLGTAMDGFTIMIITAPMTASLIVSLGYNPIWWGIMMVVLVELGEVSPPFGMNLFMMKCLVPDISMNTIFRGVMLFVVADCVKVALLIACPSLVLWLPSIAFK
jgi:tripartite ATP-independent transporter DctM subunit